MTLWLTLLFLTIYVAVALRVAAPVGRAIQRSDAINRDDRQFYTNLFSWIWPLTAVGVLVYRIADLPHWIYRRQA